MESLDRCRFLLHQHIGHAELLLKDLDNSPRYLQISSHAMGWGIIRWGISTSPGNIGWWTPRTSILGLGIRRFGHSALQFFLPRTALGNWNGQLLVCHSVSSLRDIWHHCSFLLLHKVRSKIVVASVSNLDASSDQTATLGLLLDKHLDQSLCRIAF